MVINADLPARRQHQAAGIEKVLPGDLSFVLLTFSTARGAPGGYVSNGERRMIAAALRHEGRGSWGQCRAPPRCLPCAGWQTPSI